MNLPNKLSALRIALVPLMMIFYMLPIPYVGKVIAMFLFIGAAITDLFDGKIARSRGLVTDLGKLLDPLADKLLYTCALFLLVAVPLGANSIPAMYPMGLIALTVAFARDSLVNGIRQVAASKGVVVAAAFSGKIKSVFAYIYIPMFMFIAQGYFANTGILACDIINTILIVIAYIFMVLAIVTTIWSAVDYVLINKEVLMKKSSSSDVVAEDNKETEQTDAVNENVATAEEPVAEQSNSINEESENVEQMDKNEKEGK